MKQDEGKMYEYMNIRIHVWIYLLGKIVLKKILTLFQIFVIFIR